MQYSTLSGPVALAAAFLSTNVFAHLKLKTPIPYGNASLNTNPLETDGSNWPCKSDRVDAFSVTQWNIMQINTQQNVAFIGSATHGPGSCQISLSKDTPPTTKSVFKVIKTFEGNCPSNNSGNVGTDPFAINAARVLNFSIPDTVSQGNYTLAWTWFNKIGNREMYMNCAPVTVIGSSSVTDDGGNNGRGNGGGFDALPNIFRANSGNGCTTPPSGETVGIPQEYLGKDVERNASEPLFPPVGSCSGGSGGGSIAAPAAAESSTLSSANPNATDTAQAPPPFSSSPLTQVSSTLSTSVSPASTSAALVAQPAVPGTSTGSCLTPGKSVCSPDGKAWGTCMENKQVIFQPVAVGTKCDLKLGTEVVA